ncbi:uncharacterized protein [Ptychodera flava]|uniref:uncharacterized protein isoform X2 n=1 Tax=Ptychodera flava TaxID=63121 RepID=UPI00396AA6A9
MLFEDMAMVESYTTISSRLPSVKFKPKLKSVKENSAKDGRLEIECTPMVIDFRRLFQSTKSSVDVLTGVPNKELLHTVMALYDICLPDITPEVLYPTVCDKWARTVLLVRDTKDVLTEIRNRRKKDDEKSADKAKDKPQENGENGVKGEDEVKDEEEEDEKETPGKFADVFSDTDNEDEDEDDEDDSESEDEDFSEGVDDFLNIVRKRRKKRRKSQEVRKEVPDELIGIENRLVACATWERSNVRPGEKIIQINLLGVRKRFRKWGLGKFLIQTLKDPTLVGQYDAIVVYADHGAVNFFSHYGFSDDIVLNSKFKELADNWTNSTLMCYLPPFTCQNSLGEGARDPILDIREMELELQKWTEKSREAYQSQFACTMRMRNEIITLRALVASQQDIITYLQSEVEKLQHSKFHIEKEFLQYRLLTLKAGLSPLLNDLSEDSKDGDVTADSLLKDLEEQVDVLKIAKKHSDEQTPADWQIIEEFKQSLKQDLSVTQKAEVTLLTKAQMSHNGFEQYKARVRNLTDPSMCTKMYYCGSLERPHRLQQILKNGFTEQDFSHGEYGVGLYFSQYASKAAQFSALGKLLVAEVGLGQAATVIQKDATRHGPPIGHDSILTKGRLIHGIGDVSGGCCQEYVVFHPSQALPLYLIEYKLV